MIIGILTFKICRSLLLLWLLFYIRKPRLISLCLKPRVKDNWCDCWMVNLWSSLANLSSFILSSDIIEILLHLIPKISSVIEILQQDPNVKISARYIHYIQHSIYKIRRKGKWFIAKSMECILKKEFLFTPFLKERIILELSDWW